MDINPYLADAKRYRALKYLTCMKDEALQEQIAEAVSEKIEGLDKDEPEVFDIFAALLYAEIEKQTGLHP